MNVETRNNLLAEGKWDVPGIFPHLEASLEQPIQFEMDFGLDKLPKEPGLMLIRGARQLGKSTWLEASLKASVQELGPGSCLYLNGDFMKSEQEFYEAITELHFLYSETSKIKRLFIDEITSVPDWERAVKKAFDEGTTRKTLIVTTGSQAVDLRKGAERLPGRKGKLDRTNYRFLPVKFSEFERHCRSHFGAHTLEAFQLCGGSPIAANELVKSGAIPPYVVELTKDWILGECSRQGRSPGLLTFLLQDLHRKAQSPVSLTNLAKEVGAANNTVLQGYIDLVKDLLSVASCHNVDPNTLRPLPRKAAKFHYINLLAGLAFDPDAPFTLKEFVHQSAERKGKWLEWTVASQLWQMQAIKNASDPESLAFWQNKEHEIDFLTSDKFIEVKLSSPQSFEHTWFKKIFPGKRLEVIHRDNVEEFLRAW